MTSEEYVISCIANGGGSILQLADEMCLQPEQLQDPQLRTIFTEARKLYLTTPDYDITTLMTHLFRVGQKEAAVYLATDNWVNHANFGFHARLIQQQHIKRVCLKVGRSLIDGAENPETDAFELLELSASSFEPIYTTLSKNVPVTIEASVFDAFNRAVQSKGSANGIVGIPSGISGVDRLLGGFSAPNYYIFAARPGMGKTSFALSCAYNMLLMGIPVGFFSLEMSAEQLSQRLLSIDSGIELHKIRTGQISGEQEIHLAKSRDRIAAMKLYIDHTAAQSIYQLRMKAMQWVKTKGVKIIFGDYIQLAKGTQNYRGNKNLEVTEISSGIVEMAKENNIPVVWLSQLSRDVEKTGSKKPGLSDLRDSGSLEQDCAVCGFLFRPEYYGEKTDNIGECEVIFAKNRHGSTGDVAIKFIKETTKFQDLYATPPGFIPMNEAVKDPSKPKKGFDEETGEIYNDKNDGDFPFPF